MVEGHDEWYTQVELYQQLCEEWNIFPLLDVSATDEYHMCDEYFTKEDDALTKEWVIPDHAQPGAVHIVPIWMNPPLLKGMTKKFVLKAEEQWKKWHMSILAIVPAGIISRKWFRHLWNAFKYKQGVTIEPLDRPTFIEHNKGISAQARNDYIVLVFRGNNEKI